MVTLPLSDSLVIKYPLLAKKLTGATVRRFQLEQLMEVASKMLLTLPLQNNV